MKELDIGLNSDYDECEKIYSSIIESKKNIEPFECKCRNYAESLYDSLLKSRQTHWYCYRAFADEWEEKLLISYFYLKVDIDRRKKECPFSFTCVPIGYHLEGLKYEYIYSTNIWCGCGYHISTVLPGENIPFRGYCYYSYMKARIGCWVLFDGGTMLDHFIDESHRMYTVEDIVRMKPELTYSNITMHSNPIKYLAYFRKYPESEMLGKLGLSRLEKSRACLNRLKKGDKTFMKFLFKLSQTEHESSLSWLSYKLIGGYYKRFGLDLSHWEVYKRAYEYRERMLAGSRNQYSYNQKKPYLYKGVDFVQMMEWVDKNNIDLSYYNDYLQMAYRLGHNLDDPYWRYPNNLGKAHKKVMEEMENVNKLDNLLQQSMLTEVVKDMVKFNATVDGYQIFIPNNLQDIKKQCDTLYQCLIRNDYVTKFIMQEYILVFIWKDGTPIATAGMSYDKKLDQFYGDERGHLMGNDLTTEEIGLFETIYEEGNEPSTEQKKHYETWLKSTCKPEYGAYFAFYKWLETFKPVKRKAPKTKNKVYYKGFYGKKKDGTFVGFGDFEFHVGGIYQTIFSDNEILKDGASGCNATSKVFHFCDSIQEISKHYSPKFYCIVEPLGPVLNCNGALLTNRLKVVKEFNPNTQPLAIDLYTADQAIA